MKVVLLQDVKVREKKESLLMSATDMQEIFFFQEILQRKLMRRL